jgi:hypothetical protein
MIPIIQTIIKVLSPRLPYWWGIVSEMPLVWLWGAGLVIYFPTIFFGLIVDDVHRIGHGTPKDFFNQVKAYWRNLHSSRNAETVSIKLEHFLSIVIHLVNCTLIYLAFGRTPYSLLASFFFLVAPANAQPAIWLNGKRYAISTMLVLLMWLFRPWGIIFYPFTIFWQINAILAPVLYVITGSWWLLRFLPAIPLFLLIPNANGVRGQHFARECMERFRINRSSEAVAWKARKLVLYVKCFGYNVLYALFPIRIGFFHEFMETFSVTERDNNYWYSFNRHFWGGLGVLLFAFFCVVRYWSTPVGFGLVWYVLFISQWLHFPWTITQAVATRYLYLPNAGLYLAISYALWQLPEPARRIVISVWLTYLLMRLWLYMPSFKDENNLYNNTLHTFSAQFRARSKRSFMYAARAKHAFDFLPFMAALVEAAKGLHHRPDDFRLNLDMGNMYSNLAWMNPEFMRRAKYHLEVAYNNTIMDKDKSMKDKIRERLEVLNQHIKDYDDKRTAQSLLKKPNHRFITR